MPISPLRAADELHRAAGYRRLDSDLTPRELEVLRLVAGGYAATRIARLLGISERTVHKHLERGYAKLGVHDRLTAVHRLAALGLIPTQVAVLAERISTR